MSKEIIAKLKETIKQQKERIERLKEITERERNKNSELRDRVADLQQIINEKYYSIDFSGLTDSTSRAPRIDETKIVIGYSKYDAIKKLLSQYSPSQRILIKNIVCISED